MKCPNCGGTGNIANGMWLCCECQGTGFIEDEKPSESMTNEEWFCGLNTEEKAKELLRLRLFGAVSEKGILRWLKQPHKGK